MESLYTFLIWFLVFLFILFVVAACFPKSRTWCKTQVTLPERHKEVAVLFRMKVGETELPEIPITSAQPVVISFTRPSNGTTYTVARCANFRISYNVQLIWFAPTAVSIAVQAILPDSSIQIVDGS